MRSDSSGLIRFLVVGSLRQDFILLQNRQSLAGIPGGSLFYAAAGLRTWISDIALTGRVGQSYPIEWIDKLRKFGFDTRGIHRLSQDLEDRSFYSYPDLNTRICSDPVMQYARAGLAYPKELLGYVNPTPQIDNRNQPTDYTIRLTDLPNDYLDATAAHLAPLDFLTHTLLPSALRQGQINTITLDPGAGYMLPAFWDDLPKVIKGLTAFLTSEEKIRSLFGGRSADLWEMAEAIAAYGCDLVVIRRGVQGQYLYDHSSRTRWIIPAYPARCADPTGAGDAFCGGFLAGYREHYNPLEATLHGNIAASLVIEGSGPFYAMDTLPGLAAARLDALRSSVRKG
ncbi:MAG TPA: carbohydrate kinase family protein [Anaerolineaceae bacterium]|jgi:sugar/nucleoside kinase (ribokinase family)|nr:carbohydrate kinase family protein [Anaerolineaceae bacterium]